MLWLISDICLELFRFRMNLLAKIKIFFFFFYFFLQEDFVINSQILVSERRLPFSTGLPSRSQAILLSLAFFRTFKMCSYYALNKLLKSHSHLCPRCLPCLKKHKQNKTCSTFWLSKTRVAFPLNFLRDETVSQGNSDLLNVLFFWIRCSDI